ILGYLGFATWQKRSQHKAIADAVAEGTAQLRAALIAPPSAQNIAGIESAIERLQATRASRQIAFAGAADAYLAAARTIMLRRAAALKRVQSDAKRNAEDVARIGSLPGR